MLERNLFISLVSYKTSEITCECIESIANSFSYYNGFDDVFVILSDVSGDKGLELNLLHSELSLNCYESTKIYHYKGIKLITKLEHNLGFGYANNQNFASIERLAKSNDIVWILNNDTVLDKMALREIQRAFNTDQESVYGVTLVRSDSGNVQCLGGSDQLTWNSQGQLLYENYKLKELDKLQDYSTVDGYLNGASILITWKNLKKVGYFDESFFMWCEEVEWCIRARNCGIIFKAIKNCKVTHLIGGSSENDNVKSFLGRKSRRNSLSRFRIRNYYNYRNRIYILKKHYSKYYVRGFLGIIVLAFKSMAGIIIYDTDKVIRCKLLLRSLIDGHKGNMGRTVK